MADGCSAGKIGLRLACGTAAVLTLAMVLGAVQWIGGPANRGSGALDVNPREGYRMYMTNQVSDALDGVLTVDKVYWIDRGALAAPLPDADCYGQAAPDELGEVLSAAEPLLDGQSLFFSPDITPAPGTQVQYYRDETILALTWKQVIDGGMYTFSEVKIAHPSQFRRFLAGGEFGSDKLFVTTDMAGSVNAVVASSGDFYGYRQAGTLVYDGIVRRVHNGLVDTCYIDKNGDLHFSGRSEDRDAEASQKYVDEQGILFSLAFGPVLIRDGEVVTPGSYVIGEIHDHYPRSALCQLGKLHYLLAVVNSEGSALQTPTLRRFGENLLSLGVKTAYTLDGGQTAVIAMNGKLINAVLFGYQRRISDIIYFGTAIPNREK